MLCKFPEAQRQANSKQFEEVIKLIKAIRAVRAEYKVPDNKRTKIYVQSKIKLNQNLLAGINKLGFGNQIEVVSNEGQIAEKYVKALADQMMAYLPIGQLVDEDKERERKQKEIDSLKFEIQRSTKMLENPRFVEKAPKALVDEERTKLQKNKALLESLLKD